LTLGKSIKLIRSSAGVRQRQLAERLGVSANYVSLLESDKREPSISFLRRLSKELSVPVGVFFLWQEFDSKGVSGSSLAKLREVLTRLEAMHLVSKRSTGRTQRSRRG
jgi:transcriptional regulator with XRE-family HTH domain